MKKIVRLTESDLTRIVKQVIKEQMEMSLETSESSPIAKGLRKILNSNKGMDAIKNMTYFCKKYGPAQEKYTNNVISMINNAISGIENPLNLTGGGSIAEVAKIFQKHVKTPEQVCGVIKNYKTEIGTVNYAAFGGDDEDFAEAIYDDSIAKLNFAEPLQKLLNAISAVVPK
jgi:hypothetical protein